MRDYGNAMKVHYQWKKRLGVNMTKGKLAGSINPHNNTSRSLNKNIRMTQPSLRTVGKWREEWIAKGQDKRMTFQQYKKGKCKQFHYERYLKRKKTK